MGKVDARFWKTDDRDGGVLQVFGVSIVPSSRLIEQKACLWSGCRLDMSQMLVIRSKRASTYGCDRER